MQDTLIGFILPAWTKSIKRKAISTAKFYFFDIGIAHSLASITKIEPHSDLCGQAFEHFITMELRAYISYKRKRGSLSYSCSTHEQEVNFIVGDELAIELKATKNVSGKILKVYLSRILKEENICKRYFLVSFDKINRMTEDIEIIYWEDFLNNLWAEKYYD